jgi:hypothetical protein
VGSIDNLSWEICLLQTDRGDELLDFLREENQRIWVVGSVGRSVTRRKRRRESWAWVVVVL